MRSGDHRPGPLFACLFAVRWSSSNPSLGRFPWTCVTTTVRRSCGFLDRPSNALIGASVSILTRLGPGDTYSRRNVIPFDRVRYQLRRVRTVVAMRYESSAARAQGRRVVHMLHVGKTGGTAVKSALRQQASPTIKMFLHPHHVSLADIPPDDEVFLFLRDPVSRFVSGFESRRREGRPAHYHPWNRHERAAFERFSTAEELALTLASGDPPSAPRGSSHAVHHPYTDSYPRLAG